LPVFATSSATSPDTATTDAPAPTLVKIVVAGGFGVGKTTLVASVSEIPPLTTEEYLTSAGTTVDVLTGVAGKTTTTVSMDYGRITFDHPMPLILHLFGTPGQQRFMFAWQDLTHGAIGAVILVDTRRLAESFTAVSYFEQRRVPFLVAVNQFDGAHHYTPDEVRAALALPANVPVLPCDARDTASAATVLITLVRHALTVLRSQPDGTRP
jgi:signal recognition particle receptor subunit beta